MGRHELFPERIDKGDVELFLKELRLSGEDPQWKEHIDYSRILRMGSDLRVYKLVGEEWVMDTLTSLAAMGAEIIRVGMEGPSQTRKLLPALPVKDKKV